MDRREYQVFGPPGTGKTTYLANRIKKSAEVYGSGSIIVASFTKAAAAEIASRGIAVPKDHVGTLHALCYRAIGGGKVAEDLLPDWNSRHSRWALSAGRTMDDPGEMPAGATEGDLLMQRLEVLRAKMVAPEMYPASVAAFAESWAAWKAEMGCLDFTDMVEIAYRDLDSAPGNPSIGIFDEVQDFTPLELAVVRKWGQNMSAMVLAGDDDQSIYHFKGADPAVFFEYPVPEENKLILSQSYRVPWAVQAYAERWVRRIKNRQEKEYLPRDSAGEVKRSGSFYKDPSSLLRVMDPYLEKGLRVMVLASCSYMLDPLKRLLRSEGYAFHNPYRRNRGDWNPLQRRGVGSNSTIDRLFAYLKPSVRYFGDDSNLWTLADLKKWAELIRANGVFVRGQKTYLEMIDTDSFPADDVLSTAELLEFFTPEGVAGAYSLDPQWLIDHAVASKKPALEYPIRVLERHGLNAFNSSPQIILGTIHSVKGGEADVVFLLPDLSSLGMHTYMSKDGHDSVIRQFYVGMTRARESLVLCRPSSNLAISL